MTLKNADTYTYTDHLNPDPEEAQTQDYYSDEAIISLIDNADDDLGNMLNKALDDPNAAEFIEKVNDLRQSAEFDQINPLQKAVWGQMIEIGLEENRLKHYLGMIFPDTEDFIDHIEAKKKCSPKHLQMYEKKAAELAPDFVSDRYNTLLAWSSMYAGKSTWAEAMINELTKKYNYTASRVIAGVLGVGENVVRTTGKKYEAHMLADHDVLQAIKNFEENGGGDNEELNILDLTEVENHLAELMQQVELDRRKWVAKELKEKGEIDFKDYSELDLDDEMFDHQNRKHVISIDEASFVREEIMDEFLRRLDDAGHQVIMVGLAHDSKGLPLEGMTALKQKVNEYEQAIDVECFAFTPGQNLDDPNLIPNGNRTIRYIVLPNGNMVLDIFGLPLVVDKNEGAGHYAAVALENHPTGNPKLNELIQKMNKLEHNFAAMQELLRTGLNNMHAMRKGEG